MANIIFKDNEIIVLLGAGASVEAGIPDSNEMVRQIEEKISGSDPKWSCYKNLYYYIRSSVFYADGLDGIVDDDVPFNIERLVNVLDELIKKERHTLYPFVGAWNPKLTEVAGSEFEHIRDLRGAILKILRNDWLPLVKEEEASYYAGLLHFQREYECPLRVFSLNYDLCVEKICNSENVQRGFDDRMWDWRLFDETPSAPLPLLLYKLHGSIDWHFTEDRRVTHSDSTSSIQDDDIALIFETAYKLQYIDPFLFFAYELRKWTLDSARVIICIGYGFNDDHINGILEQSLRQEEKRMLLAVQGPQEDNAKCDGEKKRIMSSLNANDNQIKVYFLGAKKFLQEKLNLAFISDLFPAQKNLFVEI